MSAKNRRTKGTLVKKDGENSSHDSNMGQYQEPPPTNKNLEIGLAQNPTSTPTQKQKIVVMYPLEKEESKSVRTIVSSFESIPHEEGNHIKSQPQGEVETTPLDPMTKMLMDIKMSNEANALRISGEIAGLSKTIDDNNKELNTKITGIQDTIKVNTEEFKKEIKRFDKRLDEGEKNYKLD